MSESVTKIAEIAIVGQIEETTAVDFVAGLHRNSLLHVVGEYQSLSAALKAGLGETLAVDFVIVLQTYSDEFELSDINALVGRMLFGRILCCYGPWCTADGRSHELWPAKFRVPIKSASALLEHELAEFRAGEQPLFPMAAGEEVFAHQSKALDFVGAHATSKAIVISNDAVLRSTVVEILKEFGCEATAAPVDPSAIGREMTRLSNQNPLILIDIDGLQSEVTECLDRFKNDMPRSQVVGLSVFAASMENVPGFASERDRGSHPDTILEKTELLLQLRELMMTTPGKEFVQHA